MKNRCFAAFLQLLALVVVTLPLSAAPAGEPLRVMTFNVLRPEWGPKTYPTWEQRKPAAAAVIAEVHPDLLGLQEESQVQLDDLLASDPELQLAGFHPGIGGSILYRRAKFALEEFGLISVPERAARYGGRFVQWGLFRKLDTGTRILFYNSHLTPYEEPMRVKGVELVLKHLHTFPKSYDYVIWVGDLNASEANESVQLLLADEHPGFHSAWREFHGFNDQKETSRLVAKAKEAGKQLDDAEKAGTPLPPDTIQKLKADLAAAGQGSFHGYLPRVRAGPIDYILVPPNIKVLKAEILTGKYKGVYPTDHFPVWADLSLLKTTK